MRSFKWAVAAFALSGLTGCFNSDPVQYRIAVSAAPNPLPNTCYRGGTTPTNPPDQQTNTVEEQTWTLWDGIDGMKYLDLSSDIRANMAHAPTVDIDADAVEGKENDDGKYVFTVERTERSTDITVVTAATYTFASMGQTAEGTVTFRSSCTGTACGNNNQLSCEYSRNFIGRRVDGDRFIIAGQQSAN
ncbi:hypothetical protein P2318_31420 [Myxococcaceae bacterium GXIMD 01537]